MKDISKIGKNKNKYLLISSKWSQTQNVMNNMNKQMIIEISIRLSFKYICFPGLFRFIDSPKDIATYFEPACHSIHNGGLLCVVVSDTSVFSRSPHVVKRWYAADTLKTEYLKEMSARIVIGNIARFDAFF